jgi:hypothetical protein
MQHTDRYGDAMRLPDRDPDAARRRFARGAMAAQEEREWYFLLLATSAPDDDSARQLEAYADDAYQDAVAIAREHDLDG